MLLLFCHFGLIFHLLAQIEQVEQTSRQVSSICLFVCLFAASLKGICKWIVVGWFVFGFEIAFQMSYVFDADLNAYTQMQIIAQAHQFESALMQMQLQLQTILELSQCNFEEQASPLVSH